MKFFVSTIAVSLFVVSGAFADGFRNLKLSKADIAHLTVSSLEVQEEPVVSTFSEESLCEPKVGTKNFLEGFDWDIIVNLGQKIWTVVEQNAPKVTTEIQSASAVPAGVTNWFDLECWQPTTARAYRVTYKNLVGVKTVDFAFKVLYNHGGMLDGRGLYLGQVTVVPTDLNVVWGYTFDAKVKIDSVMNAGTTRTPVGAIQLSLQWSVKTVLKYIEGRENYYVRGDGVFQRL